jgi:hypothetical protein
MTLNATGADRSGKFFLALIDTPLVSWICICSFTLLLVLKLDLLSDTRIPPDGAASDVPLPIDAEQLVNTACNSFPDFYVGKVLY